LLICVTRDTSVREALALMMKHDYSQLPIIDRHGHLVGIISEQTITRTYFHSWAVETMLKFVDAFQPRIRSL
jgi:CBS domain-containing protein